MRWHLRLIPSALLGVTVAVEAVAAGLAWGLEPAYDTVAWGTVAVVTAVMGALVASARSRNPIGWLFLALGLQVAVMGDLAQAYGLRAAQLGWPWGATAEWIALLSWLPGGAMLVVVFLRFPDGRLPGSCWHWVTWLAVVGAAVAMPGSGLRPELGESFVGGVNPRAIAGPVPSVLYLVGSLLLLTALVAAAVSLVLRFRRAAGVERQQLKWVAFAAGVGGVLLPLEWLLWDVTPVPGLLAAVALCAFPVAAGVAVLRHRLYELDRVVNRTLVYVSLTAVLGAAYALTALTVGVRIGRDSPVAVAAATLVVAVAFAPARAKVQDLVDRRFSRARWEARARVGAFVEDVRAGRSDPEDVERVLREVLHDPSVDVLIWLPASAMYVDVAGRPVEDVPQDRSCVRLEPDGRPLAVVAHANSGSQPAELARDAVTAATLVLEVTRLRVELRRQLAEVEDSRARLVVAQHTERRRLERDLHDGVQQRLVSIGLALRHAQHQLDLRHAASARGTVDEAVAELGRTVRELRELTHGLPPSQLDAGLAPAFHELARRASLPVDVEVGGGRWGQRLEATAYFVGCEGLTNAVKHASASRVGLSAQGVDGTLVVTVTDDGVGGATVVGGSGLRGLADRVAGVGGTLRIDSRAGVGTTITAELPCES